MAQLRSDILCKRKREDTEISERQYKRMHIAEPIQEYQSDDDEVSGFAFNAFNDSDTEELEESSIDEETNNSNNILNPKQWTKMIENWIEMVNTEVNLDSEEVVG